MLNLNKNFKYANISDIDDWLIDAEKEIRHAKINEEYVYAKNLEKIVKAVEKVKKDKLMTESLSSYIRRNSLLLEEYINTCTLAEVDMLIDDVKTSVTMGKVTIEAEGMIEDGILAELEPIMVDISFKLPGIEEPSLIRLTYTLKGALPVIQLSDLNKSEYVIDETDDSIISFKKLSKLSDLLYMTEFTETMETPFDIVFKNKSAEKKYNSQPTTALKIIALLGKDQLINKVVDYKSTHSMASNARTRHIKKVENEIKAQTKEIRSRGGKLAYELFIDDIKAAIPGIKNISSSSITKGKFYRSIKIFAGPKNDCYEILMSKNALGKSEFMCRHFNDQFRNIACESKAEVIAWLKKKIAEYDIMKLSYREREMARLRGKSQVGSIADTYEQFITSAEAYIAGKSTLKYEEIEKLYDKLWDNEAKLSDEQLAKMDELMQAMDAMV